MLQQELGRLLFLSTLFFLRLNWARWVLNGGSRGDPLLYLLHDKYHPHARGYRNSTSQQA